MPNPDESLTISIDGGYVHAREAENRKAGWFEVIVGKSMPDASAWFFILQRTSAFNGDEFLVETWRQRVLPIFELMNYIHI